MRIKSWLTAAAVVMLVLGVFAGVVMSKQTLLVIEPSKEQPRNSEGDIIELKDGRLLLVYSRFTGGGGDHSAADLAMRISGDGGKTWSEDKIIVPNKAGKNVMSVSLLRLQNGQIAMFYLPKESLADCRPVMCLSDDEGETWSEPVECITDEVGYYVMNNDRAVQLSSGRLVLPVALHNQPGWEKPDWAGTVMCYLSDDNGKSWRRSKDTFKGRSPDGKRVTLQEPGVVELKDGSVMMFIRASGGSQYICYSKDGAETWSKAEPSSLASPISPATIERIPWNGKLLCVWNDHSGLHPYSKNKRTPLCAAVSSDEGKTWSKSKIIESDPDGWYCYTSMSFVKGRVVLSYCAGDKKVGGLNRLKITSLSKKWLEGVSADKDKWENADKAVLITDLTKVEPKSALSDRRAKGRWKVIDYETASFSGNSISALPYTCAPEVRLPLKLSGYYAIYLGLGGPGKFVWNQKNMVRVKLTGDAAFQHRIYSAGKDDIDEVFFKCADLTGKDLHFAQMRFEALQNTEQMPGDHPCTVMYVKLIPLSEKEVKRIEADKKNKANRNLVATLDGFSWIANYYPTTKEELLEYFESFRDTDFGTWWWSPTGSDLVNYRSQYGSISGENTKDWPRKVDEYYTKSVLTLIDKNINITKTAIEAAHSMGSKILIYLRTQAWGSNYPFEEFFTGKFYQEHPEWRCYDRDGTPVVRMSFAVPEVREQLLNIARETLEWQPDGISIVFFRGLPNILWEDAFCKLFKEKYNADAKAVPEDDPRIYDLRCEITTDLIREFRKLLDETQLAQKRSERLELAVVVFGNEKVNRKFGVDVKKWAQEGLVDTVSAVPFAYHAVAPVDYDFYYELARESKVEFLPLVRSNIKNAESLQRDVLNWRKRGSKGILFWDPAPTRRYKVISNWSNPRNTATWPLITRMGHIEEVKNDLRLGEPSPTHIPVKRYGECYNGRWEHMTGY